MLVRALTVSLKILPRALLAFYLLAITQLATAQDARVELTQKMVDVTSAFVASLNALQSNNGVFEFDDEERLNWHFIPRRRQGVPLKSLSGSQLSKATNLLQTFFSAKGFEKTESVRSLELVLAEIEVNGMFERDPDLYYLSVFGEPSLEGDWALRYEGHHLAFNWTFVAGMGIASTPQFFGSNPAEVRSGERIGLRVLQLEEDIARGLVMSLNAEQAPKAIIRMEVPRDIYTAAEKEVRPLVEIGIAYSELSSSQQSVLVRLIEEVASAQPVAIAEKRMADIREQGLDNIKFAWIGSTVKDDAHYYRVQGPGFLIEYDNTQNNANHVHVVWRDFSGDFGRDLIRLHYDAVALEHGPGHQH